MGLFSSILKTTIDVVTLPVSAIKDVVTLGGAVTDEDSAVKSNIEKLDDDGEKIIDSITKIINDL